MALADPAVLGRAAAHRAEPSVAKRRVRRDAVRPSEVPHAGRGLHGRRSVHPHSEQGTLLYPPTHRGAQWDGAAHEPMRKPLIINMISLTHHIQLIPAAESVEHA